MEIQIGDDITVAGKVKRIENGFLMLKTKNGTEIWIEKADIKTHRPINNREEDDLK